VLLRTSFTDEPNAVASSSSSSENYKNEKYRKVIKMILKI